MEGRATTPDSSRHSHGTPEFARVTNLSDAVFAIAMTLLVLALDTPRSGVIGSSVTLTGQLPQLVAFVLAFALVGNLWWQHHKLLALFAVVEPRALGSLRPGRRSVRVARTIDAPASLDVRTREVGRTGRWALRPWPRVVRWGIVEGEHRQGEGDVRSRGTRP